MSATRFGDSSPIFGLVDESSFGYAQDFNQKTMTDRINADNQIGEVISVTHFNTHWEGSFTLIAKVGGTFPAISTAATILNLQTITKAIIYEVDRKPEQKGYEKTTFSFEAYLNVSL